MRGLKRIKKYTGFTMVELMLVTAILVVLMGVGVVAYNTMITNSRQASADKAAESIYTAVQNRLQEIYAFQHGKRKEMFRSGAGINTNVQSALAASDVGDDNLVRLGETNGGTVMDENTGNALKVLTADGNVIAAEFYQKGIVVEFDPVVCQVYSVTYLSDLNKGYDLTGVYTSENMTTDNVRDMQSSASRKENFKGYVGYYQSDVGELMEGSRSLMTVSVGRPSSDGFYHLYNYDELKAEIKIKLPDTDTTVYEQKIKGKKVAIEVSVSGLESGKQITFLKDGILETSFKKKNKRPTMGLSVTLDSLNAGGRFKQLFGSGSSGDLFAVSDAGNMEFVRSTEPEKTTGALIPGENIKVTVNAWTYDENATDKLAKASAQEAIDNSLFAFGSNGSLNGSAYDTYAAYLAYGRHLQNLDKNLFQGTGVIKAKQVKDIDFDLGKDDFNEDGTRKDGVTGDWTADDIGRLWKDAYTTGEGDSAATRTFIPIVNAAVTELDGKCKIEPTVSTATEEDGSTAVTVAANEIADADLADGDQKSIYNLTVNATTVEYKEFDSSKANAGVFDTFKGNKISGIYLISPKIAGTTTGSTGGLAGMIDNSTVEILSCELYMRPKGKEGNALDIAEGSDANTYKGIWLSGGASAGGLVGTASADLTINGSFAATVVNAQANGGKAGGLVGSATGTLAVADSYADCYIAAGNAGNVGGLAGACAETSTFKNCYSAGFILGGGIAHAGQFAPGPVGLGDTNSYSIFNFTDPIDTGNTISSPVLHEGLKDVSSESNDNAGNPYYLARTLGDLTKYPYPLIGIGSDNVVLPHYGDWLASSVEEATKIYAVHFFDQGTVTADNADPDDVPLGYLYFSNDRTYYYERQTKQAYDTAVKDLSDDEKTAYASGWVKFDATGLLGGSTGDDDTIYYYHKLTATNLNGADTARNSSTIDIFKYDNPEGSSDTESLNKRKFLRQNPANGTFDGYSLEPHVKGADASSESYVVKGTDESYQLTTAVLVNNKNNEALCATPVVQPEDPGASASEEERAEYGKELAKYDRDHAYEDNVAGVFKALTGYSEAKVFIHFQTKLKVNDTTVTNIGTIGYSGKKYIYYDAEDKSLNVAADPDNINKSYQSGSAYTNLIPQYDSSGKYGFVVGSSDKDKISKTTDKGAFRGYYVTEYIIKDSNGNVVRTETSKRGYSARTSSKEGTPATDGFESSNYKNGSKISMKRSASFQNVVDIYARDLEIINNNYTVHINVMADWLPAVTLHAGYYKEGKVGTAEIKKSSDKYSIDADDKYAVTKRYYLNFNRDKVYTSPLLTEATKLKNGELPKEGAMTSGYVTTRGPASGVDIVKADYIRIKDGGTAEYDSGKDKTTFTNAQCIVGGALRGYYYCGSGKTSGQDVYTDHDMGAYYENTLYHTIVSGSVSNGWKFNTESLRRPKTFPLKNWSYEDAQITANAFYSYKVDFRASSKAENSANQIVGQMYFLPGTNYDYYYVPDYTKANKVEENYTKMDAMVGVAKNSDGRFRGFYVTEDDQNHTGWAIVGAGGKLTYRARTIKRSYIALNPDDGGNEAVAVDRAIVHVMVPLPGVTVSKLTLTDGQEMSTADWEEWQKQPVITATDHCTIKVDGEEVEVDGRDYIYEWCTLYYVSGNGSNIVYTNDKNSSSGSHYLTNAMTPTARANMDEKWDFLKTYYGAFDNMYFLNSVGDAYVTTSPLLNEISAENSPRQFGLMDTNSTMTGAYGSDSYTKNGQTYLQEGYVYAKYYRPSDDKQYGVQIHLNVDDTYYDSIFPNTRNRGTTNVMYRAYAGLSKRRDNDGYSKLGGTDGRYTNLSYLVSGIYNTPSNVNNDWANKGGIWQKLRIDAGYTLRGLYIYSRTGKNKMLNLMSTGTGDGDNDISSDTNTDPISAMIINQYITETDSPVVNAQAEWYTLINSTGWGGRYYYYNGRRFYGKDYDNHSELTDAYDVKDGKSFDRSDRGLGDPGASNVNAKCMFGSDRLWNSAPSKNANGSNQPVSSNSSANLGGDTLILNYAGTASDTKRYVCTKNDDNSTKHTQTLFVTKANGNYAVIDYYINDIYSQYGKAAYYEDGYIYNKDNKLVTNLSELVGNRFLLNDFNGTTDYEDFRFELNDGTHDGTVVRLESSDSGNTFTGYLWKYDDTTCTITENTPMFTADKDGNITYTPDTAPTVYYYGTGTEATKKLYGAETFDKTSLIGNLIGVIGTNWSAVLSGLRAGEAFRVSTKNIDSATNAPYVIAIESTGIETYPYKGSVGDRVIFFATEDGAITYASGDGVLTIKISDAEGNEFEIYYYFGKFYKGYGTVEGNTGISYLVRTVDGVEKTIYLYDGTAYDTQAEAEAAKAAANATEP